MFYIVLYFFRHQFFPVTWQIPDIGSVTCPKYFKIPANISKDGHRFSLIYFKTDWFVHFAIYCICSMCRQLCISKVSLFFLHSGIIVQLSTHCRKTEEIRVLTYLIFVCLVIASSCLILISYSSIPHYFSTFVYFSFQLLPLWPLWI